MSKEKPRLQEREFKLLLIWLAGDSEREAQAYLDYHKRMTALFINWQSCAPEDLADESLNRVARQLLEGKEIKTSSHGAYLHGIAKNIRREHWRDCETCKRQRVMRESDEDADSLDSRTLFGSRSATADDDDKERRLQCLDECLEEFSAEDRSVLLEYYSEDKTLKLVTRNRMAVHLGVTSGALRQRIWKLRNSLRECVVKCLA